MPRRRPHQRHCLPRHRPVNSGLVVTRHVDESVVIGLLDGRQIIVTPVRISDGKVRMHIAAPRELPISRATFVNNGCVNREAHVYPETLPNGVAAAPAA